jgi:hypothetical protein
MTGSVGKRMIRPVAPAAASVETQTTARQRIPVELDADMVLKLRMLRATSGLPVSEIIRSLVAEWGSDLALQERVLARALGQPAPAKRRPRRGKDS